MKTILTDVLRGGIILCVAGILVSLIWLVFGVLMPTYPLTSIWVGVPLLCWGLGWAFKLWAT